MCRRQAAIVRPRAAFPAAALLLAAAAGASPAHARPVPLANSYDETGGAMSMWGQPLTSSQMHAPEGRRSRGRHGGASEIRYMPRGSFDTPRQGTSDVLSEASRWIGQGNVTGSHRAWCADFANFVLQRTGHHASGSGMVDSLLGVGRRVATPQAGDLVVMRSHVTIFAGYSGHGFYGLGGNQHHRVAMSNFSMRSVVAFVRPS